jgi:hypothetical protein
MTTLEGILIKKFLEVQEPFFKRGWHPQPIHGQTDAALSELHLKSMPKKQSFRRY